MRVGLKKAANSENKALVHIEKAVLEFSHEIVSNIPVLLSLL